MRISIAALCVLVCLSVRTPSTATEPVVVLDAMDSTSNWVEKGIALSISSDCVEGNGALLLTGSGHVRFNHERLNGLPLKDYDRLVMNVKIPDGQVTDFGLVTKGFPQTEGINFPRWAKYDETTPAGVWIEYSCDLRLCEWHGGNAGLLDENQPALSLIYTPGRGNTGILVDNIRLIADPVRITYDWLPPVKPLRTVTNSAGARYEKEIELENVSGRLLKISTRFSKESLRKFTGSVTPPEISLEPGAKKTFLARIDAPKKLKPLDCETQIIEIVPDGDERLVRRIELLTAAPFPPVKHPFTVKEAKMPPGVRLPESIEPARLPKNPCWWLDQSALNTKGRCDAEHVGQVCDGFDRLKCSTCGKVQEGTKLTGGIWHRILIDDALNSATAYQATKDIRYAQRARAIFLAYAAGYHAYTLDKPVTEASSHLSPYNATYILGSVVMTPMSRALDMIWDSGALSDADKQKIIEGFVYPAALEMLKINPGMTNMQDAMTAALFNLGLTIGDANMVAIALFGSHGLLAKINSVFDEDGATPESISSGYHGAALTPVLAQVEAIHNAGLNVDIKFDRLEKAKNLMAYMRMPNGRVPNRGDAAFPAAGNADAALAKYGSMSFKSYGMTVLREGEGTDALYVAIDHRPPAVTHSHFDKLSIVLYGKGEYLGVDEGSLYNADCSKQAGLPNWGKRSVWGHHSFVHNTITVDEQSQQYGGGKLLYFHDKKDAYQAVAASSDNVYKDVLLERNIVMFAGVIVMADRCLSDKEHTYDWTHHSFGALAGPDGLKPRDRLGSEPPYSLPENVGMGALPGQAAFTWKRDSASLRLTVLPEGKTETQYATAVGWANEAYQKARLEAPFVLARRKGKEQRFVTVFEPFKGDAPTVLTIAREPVTAARKKAGDNEAVGLKITKANETLFFLINFSGGEKVCGPIRSAERCGATREGG